MENSEIRNLKDNELVEKVTAEKANLQRMKFAHAISPLENPTQIGKTRKLIARLNTEVRSRELTKIA